MKIGIIGLPNVGKSSLFNLLTNARAQVATFPFTTIDRNLGMVSIPDSRLEQIVGITKSPKMKYASIEFIDIAGLIKGAAQGEGLGNQFLSHIRDVDLIVHVLRCFTDEEIAHTDEEIIPQKDYAIVRTELFLSDLSITERKIERIKKKAECQQNCNRLERIKATLSQGEIPEETPADLPLLTKKKEIVVLNLDQEGSFSVDVPGYRLSVKLEEELENFSIREKQELRKEARLEIEGLQGLIMQCLEELSIIRFYTIKGDEARAWVITKGTSVWDAAGMIHGDMQKGFIKAEILRYSDFVEAQGFIEAQRAGKTRIEGKEYAVNDGDIILIKFRA